MVATVREEAVAVAGGAQVEAIDVLDAGGAQRALGRRPEVEPAALVHDVLSECLPEGRCHLVAHLVAARTDARADRCYELAGADRPYAGSDDAGQQAAP